MTELLDYIACHNNLSVNILVNTSFVSTKNLNKYSQSKLFIYIACPS